MQRPIHAHSGHGKFEKSLVETKRDRILIEHDAQIAHNTFCNILTQEYNRYFPKRKHSKNCYIKKHGLHKPQRNRYKLKTKSTSQEIEVMNRNEEFPTTKHIETNYIIFEEQPNAIITKIYSQNIKKWQKILAGHWNDHHQIKMQS